MTRVRTWLQQRAVAAAAWLLVKITRAQMRLRLRRAGRQRLAPASLSHGLVQGNVVLRLTPLEGAGTLGDLYCAMSGVDAQRLGRELLSLAKKAGAPPR